MHTNVVDFRVMRRLCRREWNWQSVNQHSWDPRQWTMWSRRVTCDFNSVLICSYEQYIPAYARGHISTDLGWGAYTGTTFSKTLKISQWLKGCCGYPLDALASFPRHREFGGSSLRASPIDFQDHIQVSYYVYASLSGAEYDAYELKGRCRNTVPLKILFMRFLITSAPWG